MRTKVKTGKNGKKAGRRMLPEPVQQGLFSLNLAQCMVFFNGLVLTVTAFVILNVFITGMLREDFDRFAQNTVAILSEGVDDMESSMQTISALLLLSSGENKKDEAARVRSVAPDLSLFDHIIWLYESRPGIWQFNNIFVASRSSGDFQARLRPDQAFISYIVSGNYFASDKVQLVSDVPGMDYFKVSDNPLTMVRPFAFVKALEKENSRAGILIGLTSVSRILAQSPADNRKTLSRLSIRELSSEQRIFHIDSSADGKKKYGLLTQTYVVPVINKKWETDIEFSKDQKSFFMENISWVVPFFGLIFTLIGTLYVRNNQKQAFQLTRMNRALEQKNFELENEVAERERLNNALRKAERENRAIIDSVSDIIFETDTEGQVLFLNATWQKVTGFDPEQSRGRDLFSMMHPQDQEIQRHDFEKLVKGQKSGYRSFARLRVADGTFRAVEMAVSMIRQDDNKKLRVVGTLTDVEERRRAERALAEAEKKYRTIVENAAGGIYQLTPEGLYLSANPAMARILGYESPEDILRDVKNANETVYVNVKERSRFVDELGTRGIVNNFETEVRTKDGGKIWVNENARAVKDESGNILYYEGSIEDITARKEADIGLREAKMHSDLANRAKSEFLANMSHELRTPLNAIIGFSEIIKNETFGPVGQKAYWEYARDIHQSGRKLLNIINEILDISKIEAGERHLNESVVNIGKVVAASLDLLATKIQKNNMTVNNMLGDVSEIVGEEVAIKQVISNILSNAVKFTPNGGTISISSEIGGEGNFRLSITDTGIGLDEKEIRKALSPFGQVDNALNRSGSGAGLGLTLVSALLRLHGGELELFSEKGIGTTATIVLPAERVAKKKQKDEKPQSGKEDGRSKSGPGKVDFDTEGADVF